MHFICLRAFFSFSENEELGLDVHSLRGWKSNLGHNHCYSLYFYISHFTVTAGYRACVMPLDDISANKSPQQKENIKLVFLLLCGSSKSNKLLSSCVFFMIARVQGGCRLFY